MCNCRVCGNSLEKFLDLGKMPLANGFLYEKDFSNEYFYNLAVGFCNDCSLVQLIEQPEPEKMFNENYPFFTSSSKFMVEHFRNMALDVISVYGSDPRIVVEIGSNDGSMLKVFKERGCEEIGIEPSKSAYTKALSNGIFTLNEFFNKETARVLWQEVGSADIIVSANVICHIADINSVFEGVSELLDEDGIFVFEEPYIGSILNKVSYDQIYDEHVFYFSATSVKKIAEKFGMSLFMVRKQNVHGGSLRYYICKDSRPTDFSLVSEKDFGINKFFEFADLVEKSKYTFKSLLEYLKDKGNSIVGYAATSKSTTILNYCGIDNSYIDCIYDTTKEKWNKFTPGTHIPVISYDRFKNDSPEYSVLFAWNHRNEILNKEKDYKGKFILPHPTARIL